MKKNERNQSRHPSDTWMFLTIIQKDVPSEGLRCLLVKLINIKNTLYSLKLNRRYIFWPGIGKGT